MNSARNGEDNADAAPSTLRAEFTARATAVGTEVLVAELNTLVELVAGAALPLREGGIRVSTEAAEAVPQLTELCREGDEWPAVAISRSPFALAVTGSVVLAEGPEDRRYSLLCYRHIVLVPATPLATLQDAAPSLRAWAARGSRRYVTFVTGPSRTSDIERVLTVGVHGPAELVVVLVDGWELPHA